jgi:hypothetical protein
MERHYSLYIMIGLFAIGLPVLNAQTAIPASGGNASGTGGSISYSVGQVVYTIATGSNGSIIQGVQQPFEISVVTGIEEVKDITLEMMVYPNPATNLLRLRIENYPVDNLRYELYNMYGSNLQNKKVEKNETDIIMGRFPSGTYFLKINDGKKWVRTFKIIKK